MTQTPRSTEGDLFICTPESRVHDAQSACQACWCFSAWAKLDAALIMMGQWLDFQPTMLLVMLHCALQSYASSMCLLTCASVAGWLAYYHWWIGPADLGRGGGKAGGAVARQLRDSA